jgi:hypothetical protein
MTVDKAIEELEKISKNGFGSSWFEIKGREIVFFDNDIINGVIEPKTDVSELLND